MNPKLPQLNAFHVIAALKKDNWYEYMKYTIILQPWEDGQGYTIIVPSLPGCFTQGSTKEEAITNAREAILCHIEGLKKAGEEVPVETDTPELAQVAI